MVDLKNHTLKETTNYMLQDEGLDLQFWIDEAINCENYIVNCTPTKSLKGITLEEAMQ